MFPSDKLSGKQLSKCGNKIADSSRDGVDSFLTYLHKGVSRRPIRRISDNYIERICAFLYATYSNIGVRLCKNKNTEIMNIPIFKVGDNGMKITIEKKLYSKEAIVAACYKFTDKLYFFQQFATDNNEKIEVIAESINGQPINEEVVKKFCNELIDQQVRYNTNQQFGHIRDLIVEEAFKPVNK